VNLITWVVTDKQKKGEIDMGSQMGSVEIGSSNPEAPAVIEAKHQTSARPGSVANRELIELWIKRMEETARGRLKITNYPGDVLTTNKNALEACATGICDFARLTNSVVPGKFPLMDLLSSPGIGITSSEMGGYILMKFFNNHPELVEKELPGVKFLFGYTIAGMAIGTGKVPVRRVEDLRGLKLRVGGRGPAEFYKALGATPVMLSDADIFMSMEKGVIDSWNSSMNAVALLSLHEVTKYYTRTSFFVGPNVTIMNLKLWNSLPSDMQTQIMRVKGIEWAVETGRIHDRLIKEDTEKAIKEGGEYITLSPEERARWRKVAGSLWDKEVARLNARGLPGRALLDEVLQLVEEYGKR